MIDRTINKSTNQTTKLGLLGIFLVSDNPEVRLFGIMNFVDVL